MQSRPTIRPGFQGLMIQTLTEKSRTCQIPATLIGILIGNPPIRIDPNPCGISTNSNSNRLKTAFFRFDPAGIRVPSERSTSRGSPRNRKTARREGGRYTGESEGSATQPAQIPPTSSGRGEPVVSLQFLTLNLRFSTMAPPDWNQDSARPSKENSSSGAGKKRGDPCLGSRVPKGCVPLARPRRDRAMGSSILASLSEAGGNDPFLPTNGPLPPHVLVGRIVWNATRSFTHANGGPISRGAAGCSSVYFQSLTKRCKVANRRFHADSGIEVPRWHGGNNSGVSLAPFHRERGEGRTAEERSLRSGRDDGVRRPMVTRKPTMPRSACWQLHQARHLKVVGKVAVLHNGFAANQHEQTVFISGSRRSGRMRPGDRARCRADELRRPGEIRARSRGGGRQSGDAQRGRARRATERAAGFRV